MAVSTGTDPIRFEPNDHDVRIVRSGWVFYVRGVKRGERLIGGGLTLEGGLLAAAMLLVAGRRIQGWHERQSWKVGVVRLRADGGGLIRKIYSEQLPSGEEPAGRIAELADDVRRGKFDPA